MPWNVKSVGGFRVDGTVVHMDPPPVKDILGCHRTSEASEPRGVARPQIL